ncbi:MAG: ABC transporter ATP-binding protein [Desulfovermiculus sp.]|nr:ABC transporter ATP-binding protein [Desulfovermiculus sp.]
MQLLTIKDLFVYYGKAIAIESVNLTVDEGECVGIIGPNGAGKTTLLRSISNIKAWQGEIYYNGQSLFYLTTRDLVKLGIVQVPEGRHLFPQLTVRENILLGAFTIDDPKIKSENSDYVLTLFPRLKERLKQLAGTLSGGEQQMLAIARAIMASPKLLLMDEPSFGLAPKIKEYIDDAIHHIQAKGVTMLLVEQDATMVFELSHRVYVLEQGKITINGLASELANDQRIRDSYLGIS